MTPRKGKIFFMRQALALLFLFIFIAPAKAETTAMQKADYRFKQTNQNTGLNPRDSTDSDTWKFVIAPYLWALNMDGSVQIKGTRAAVNETFGDILSQLNWAGMLWLEAYKNKFGIFANALYSSLSQGASDRYISARVNTNFGLYSAGLSYEVYKTCLCSTGCAQGGSTFALVPYVGARYTSNDVSLTVNTPFGSIRSSDDQHWTDPIIGARLNFDLTPSWRLNFAGDIGGTNAASDYSYDLWGLVGFKPQTVLKSTTWYLGYRYLFQHYSTGSSSNYFLWHMKLNGPLVGVSFTF